MDIKRLNSTIAALICVLSYPLTTFAASTDPAQPVRLLYESYGTVSKSRPGFDEHVAAKVLDASLLKIYNQAKNLDYDFFIQGQDFSFVKAPAIRTLSRRASTAKVQADIFEKFEGQRASRKQVVFMLVLTGKGWLIDNAIAGTHDLRTEWQAAR